MSTRSDAPTGPLCPRSPDVVPSQRERSHDLAELRELLRAQPAHVCVHGARVRGGCRISDGRRDDVCCARASVHDLTRPTRLSKVMASLLPLSCVCEVCCSGTGRSMSGVVAKNSLSTARPCGTRMVMGQKTANGSPTRELLVFNTPRPAFPSYTIFIHSATRQTRTRTTKVINTLLASRLLHAALATGMHACITFVHPYARASICLLNAGATYWSFLLGSSSIK